MKQHVCRRRRQHSIACATTATEAVRATSVLVDSDTTRHAATVDLGARQYKTAGLACASRCHSKHRLPKHKSQPRTKPLSLIFFAVWSRPVAFAPPLSPFAIGSGSLFIHRNMISFRMTLDTKIIKHRGLSMAAKVFQARCIPPRSRQVLSSVAHASCTSSVSCAQPHLSPISVSTTAFGSAS
jgi:hypothetical protein